MRWITTSQLENWARGIPARDELPKIVSDLIRASSPDIASMRFPSGDKGQVRGFDGHLESDVSAFNVPQGRSFWEFSADEDYKQKAQSDFEKRTKEVPPADQSPNGARKSVSCAAACASTNGAVRKSRHTQGQRAVDPIGLFSCVSLLHNPP
jgi:hypothetical protein